MKKIVKAVNKLLFIKLMNIRLERIVDQFSFIHNLCILILVLNLVRINTVKKLFFEFFCAEMEKMPCIIPDIILFLYRTAVSADFIFFLNDEIISLRVICKGKT